jgi:hypothetical protein
MQQEFYNTKLRLISGLDLYRILFFLYELLILHSDEYLQVNYALTLT